MALSQRFLRLNGMALVIGALVGLAAVGFRYLIDWIESVAFTGDLSFAAATAREKNEFISSPWGLLIVLVPLAGGLAVGLIRKTWPETRQQGVAEVMAAVQAKGGILKGRSSIGHAIISAITVGTGGSTGREGPIGYIGAAVGSSFARRLDFRPRDIKVLLGAGFGAGIGATFNAPMGGVLLALELILPEFSTHAFIPLVGATVAAVAVSHIFLANESTFFVPQFTLSGPYELGVYLVLGVACGLGGVAFIRMMSFMQRFWRRAPVVEWLRPAAGGLVVGLTGLALFTAFGQYHVFGTGYATVSALLVGNPAMLSVGLLVALLILKPFATTTTIGSGGGGGIFSASLYQGALVGALVGLAGNAIAPQLVPNPVPYALVGMAAFYAATARATLTAIVVMAELAGDFTILLPIMIAAVSADAISVGLSRESIYTVRLSDQGILYDHDRTQSPLDFLQVRNVMNTRVDTLQDDLAVGDAYNRMLDGGHTGYPVLAANGKLRGLVTRRDLSTALHEGKGQVKLGDLLAAPAVVAHPDEMLYAARDRMFKRQIGRLLIVDAREPTKLLGILTRSDLLRAEAEMDVEHDDPLRA